MSTVTMKTTEWKARCPVCGRESAFKSREMMPPARGLNGLGGENAYQEMPAGWLVRARVPNAGTQTGPSLQAVCSAPCAVEQHGRELDNEGLRTLDAGAAGFRVKV